MSETNNEALIQFEQLPEIVGNAPQVLQQNTQSVSKALDIGQTLLDTIDGEDMTPEMDAECNSYLLKIGKTLGNMNDRRAPITKMLTAISKEFTGLENKLDPKKDGTVPFKIQAARNDFARKVAAEQRKQELILRTKQLADAERIDITSKVELRVRERCNEVMFACKKKYNDIFNSLTLENQAAVIKELSDLPVDYARASYNEISCPITCLYVQSTELPGLVFDTKAKLYDELSANFRENMESHKMNLQDQIPARIQELERIDKAGKEEAKQLAAQAEIRKQEESLRLEKENQRKAQEAIDQADLKKEVGTAQLSFEKDMGQAEIMGMQTATTKSSYVINVMTPSGWQQIAALWFKSFLKNTPFDKFEKKTLGAMKADLEKQAFNGGERLEDSGHLVYLEDIKALTKKA